MDATQIIITQVSRDDEQQLNSAFADDDNKGEQEEWKKEAAQSRGKTPGSKSVWLNLALSFS